MPARKSKSGEGYTPPKGVRSNAARGLELRRKHGRGGTLVGVARARDLSNGKSISLSTIGRMVSFFARHSGNQEGGEDDAGYIAWLLWGGDAGKRWANSIWSEARKGKVTALMPMRKADPRSVEVPAGPKFIEKFPTRRLRVSNSPERPGKPELRRMPPGMIRLRANRAGGISRYQKQPTGDWRLVSTFRPKKKS